MLERGLSFALRCLAIFVALAVAGTWIPAPVAAVGELEFAKDTITSNIPNKLDVNHTIDFSLPITSQAIIPSDWIHISFPNYFRLTPPSASEGGFGTPVFYLEGNRVKINNLSLLPGTSLQIRGITAQNPTEGDDTSIVIQVTDDAAGLTVRNQARVTPSQGAGYVQLSATIKSPLAAVSISGFSSPGAFITLSESGTVIGTTASDSQGYFSFPVTGMDPGVHNFRISGSDTDDRTTSQASISLNLIGGTVTSAENILLSPSLELNLPSIKQGDALTISGAAKPNSQVNIFIESPLRNHSATTNSLGDWSYTLTGEETATYTPGEYRVYTNMQDAIGNQSIASNTLTFQVTAQEDENNPSPDCDISQGDLNCDTRTNLTDFSILLFHWQTNHKVADINSDTFVNLVDFSIMMFYFRL